VSVFEPTTLKIDHTAKVDVTLPVPEPSTYYLKDRLLAEEAVTSAVPEPTTLKIDHVAKVDVTFPFLSLLP